ncbi:hypothetical protein LUZ62_085936 [Rhynchospora pubera]|uniref:UBX domain-containing protein n=1 Tax=Rhynchospora pubera TaxID=906938 RepID=A0AAV8C7Y8_9POAL|nr:hypothetical protein LUZ62_085936 [Rhynchospora pubera]
MVNATETLVYKGSIVEAITEARSQKKLFVVYISGEDENSILLEQSTWMDQNVHEVITRCCIFLHLIQGSVDASQFSAIYPQNSIPSISSIGLNGVLLWHHEGYINAENLGESIEKSLATLHLQETATTLLTAALASQSTAPVTGASASSSSTEGGPTMSTAARATQSPAPVSGTSAASPSIEDAPTVSDTPLASSSMEPRFPVSTPTTSSDKKLVPSNSQLSCDREAVAAEEECQQRDNAKSVSTSEEAPSVKALVHEAMKGKAESSATSSTEKKTQSDGITKDVVKSVEVHLNIRMPNGTSLQIKLVKSDALRSVKHFIDEQQDIQANSYNLAVPYPRKLFNEEDMDKTLSELGFANRETVIVVPHQSSRSFRSQPASNNSINRSQNTSNEDSTSYFGYLRRFLSYVNPLSYIWGNTGSDNLNRTTNSADQNPLPGEGTSQSSQSPVNMRERTASRSFGSNIHTLRHDEGTEPSHDRNTFWNGNSTQFGSSDQQ